MAEKMDSLFLKGSIFFPDFGIIFGFTQYQKLWCAAGNTTFITASVQSSRDFEDLLGKNYLQNLINKLLFDWIPLQEEFDI